MATELDGVKTSYVNADQLPLVVSALNDTSIPFLKKWIKGHRDFLKDKVLKDGAILFRGFDVKTPEDFEEIAIELEPKLRTDYLGTSSRHKKTEHVFTASEIPRIYPIPQHCEMSFTKRHPAKIIFACTKVSPVGGETPLCDFRKVYQDLDPEVRKRWENKGLTYVRNYNGPKASGNFDPLKLKKWNEVFETDSKKEVEKQCKDEEYKFTWVTDDFLHLENTREAVLKHPVAGTMAWHNHAHIFHPSVQYAEFRQFTKFLSRDYIWNWLMFFVALFVATLKRIFVSKHDATDCMFGDGTAIPSKDLQAVRDTMWRHMKIMKWQQGDVMFIDNYSVSHGRLPFAGPRMVLTAMSEQGGGN